MSMRDRLIALGVIAAAYTGNPEDPGPRDPDYPTGGGYGPDNPGGGGSGGNGGAHGNPPPPYTPPPTNAWNPKVPKGPPRINDKTPKYTPPNWTSPPNTTPIVNGPFASNHTRPTITNRNVQIDPAGAVVPPIYGVYNLGTNTPYRPIFVNAWTDTTGRFLTCLWVIGMGPMPGANPVTDLCISGQPFAQLGLVLNTSYYVHTGTASQTPDPLLVAADPNGYGLSGYPGIVYVTAVLDGSNPIASKVDPQAMSCTVTGLGCRDPRTYPGGTAPTAAAGAAGVLTGTYSYRVTFVDGSGNESGAGAISNSVTLASQKGSLTAVPTGPGGTASRNIYRTLATDLSGPWFLAGSIANNTTTTFTDNTADASLGAEIPYVCTNRTATTNPFVAWFDFRTSGRYGFNIADRTVDWQSVSDGANDCDFSIASPSASPSAPSVAQGAAFSGGLMTGVSYKWAYTYVVNGVETGISAASSTLTPNTSHQLSSATVTITAGPTGTTSRRIYRNKGLSLSFTPMYLVTEIFDNTTLTFTDTFADYQLQTTQAPPSAPASYPRYGIGIVCGKSDTLQNWDDTIRAHCSAYLSHDTQWHAFVDLARSPSAVTFDTTNIIGEIQISTMGLAQRWSRVVVQFYNALISWKQDQAAVEHPYYALPPTETQREERREADYTLDGIPNWDQAKRIATQIFNRARINKQIIFNVNARGLRLLPGIVVEVTHPTGPLSATQVIVTDVQLANQGETYQVTGEFYDPTVYLDTVQINGTPIVPPNGSPFATPADPTSCAVAEVDYYGDDGGLHASLSITWVPTPSPFFLGTRIDYSVDGGVTWISTGGFHPGGAYTLENVMIGTLYTIRLATVLVTLVQSDYVTLTYTPDLLGTIQEVTQAKILPSAQFGAFLKFYGPRPSHLNAPRNQAPAAAPTLGLNSGGISTIGAWQIAYSRVTSNTETPLSPAASITTFTGNRIIAISNLLDSDGSGGGAGVLFKKVYAKAPGFSDFNWVTDLPVGTTSMTLNFAPVFDATLVEPNVFDGIAYWLISDNSFSPPIPAYQIPVLSPPNSTNPFAIPALVHIDPTTGLPRADALIQVVDKLGNLSVGVAVSNTGVGYPTLPLTQSITQQQAVTLANGANNNVATNGVGRQRISGPTAAFNITGFAGGTAGQEITIINTTAQTMTLRHKNAGSTSANQVICPGGADIAYSLQDQCVTLHYDETSAMWRVVGP